jgi:hypothetical protein
MDAHSANPPLPKKDIKVLAAGYAALDDGYFSLRISRWKSRDTF